MPTMQRFLGIDKAILVTTGNSLVVCGSNSEAEVNTSDLIKIDGTTTRDWTQAGSTANLNILSNSTILYAELIWYSTVFSNVSGTTDLRSVQDNAITFVTPKGSYSIAPLYTDTNTSSSGTIDRFRAADVTSYVQASLSGNYIVSDVPISVPSTGLSNSIGGWSLNVIYRNNSFSPKKIIYNSGISVATFSTPLQTTVSGFTTAADEASLKGSVALVCANGGPLSGEKKVYAGPSFAQLTNIGNSVNSPSPNPGKAPNNPGNNFFSGIINVSDPISDINGLLNIAGTNGLKNHDGFIPIQTLGGRNKWDITNVDISKTLVPNQNLLVGEITTSETGDGIQLIAFGTQVVAKAPNIIATLVSYDIDGDDEYNVQVGEPLVYAIQIKNDGDVPANNVIVSAILDTASTFVPGSVTINGATSTNANIVNGINIGTVEAKGIVTVMFTVTFNSVPAGGLAHQNVNYSYQFVSGVDTITNTGVTNTEEIIVQQGLISVVQSASKSSMYINDTVTYTFNVQNIGTEVAKNIFFQDKINSNCNFVDGTVSIGGISYSEYNPTEGFPLSNLNVGDNVQITFQAKVNTLPASTKVNNLACVSFEYYFNQYTFPYKKTIFSNATSIQVQYVDVIGQLSNNNNYPNVGDTVTYTLSLTNVGNIDADNVQVLQTEIPGTSFINGSVKINGVMKPDLDPFVGFILTDPITPKATTNIEYKILVNSIDAAKLIKNIAKVPFKYQISQGGTVITSEKDSNIVDTVTNFVCMNIYKSVDKAYATIDDILYYTMEVTNNGNINATDTVFLDSIQQEAAFIAGTVAINGILYPAYNPNTGFSIGIVPPNDTVEITFQAKVNNLPSPNTIYNSSSLVYSYKPDPNGNLLSNTVSSNTVQTIINKAQYTITKTVDKFYAQVGDNLVYTTTIKNTGTVPLTNLIFSDFIGVYLSFYPGTVYINGVNYPDYNPSNSFVIDDLHPGDTATVIFGVTIVSNPPVGYIPNVSQIAMTYQQNPNSPVISKTVYSNEVRTYDPYASISLAKSVDKSYATVGDTLTYFFIATNNGTSTAINTLFADMLQEDVSFVAGSVLVNGISMTSYDPTVGFTLGSMVRGQVINVEFKVVVNKLPNLNTVKNSSSISYSYYVDPTQQPISKTSTSNIATTIINVYSATLTKTVDKAYATIGDVLDYTIVATNTGTVTLTNVNLKDIIPDGATFKSGSVMLDGVNLPDANPNTGFTINNVLPGGNVVVMFKATVTSVPTPPQIKNTANVTLKYQLSPSSPHIDDTLTSNTVTTNVSFMSVTNTKSVSKTYATIGDTLTYTSVITNNGNVSISNTEFIDSIPEHTTFVSGTVKIDGISYTSYNPNTGFTLGNISSGAHVAVTFDVTVDSLPPSGYVTNTSNINYQYKIDPNGQSFTANITSNAVTTYINYGNLSVTKVADRDVVKLNNIITYSFVLFNTGNTILKSLLFKDIIQAESSFNTGTVYVNGVNMVDYNPNTGFNLDDIPVGQQTTVSFKVTANSVPQNNKLLNTASVTYGYYVDPNGSITTKTMSSNTTTVYVYDTIISANKSVDKSIAKIGDTLNFTITIKNEENITAQHVNFVDILDSNISFVTDSVYVNDVQKIGYNPNNGFGLDDILANGTTVVKFAATISSRPANNIIYNHATINYDYTVGSDVIEATMNTNITETHVAVGELTVTKAVDKVYATVGDNLAYTVVVKNTGSVNVTSLSLQDLLPASTSFVAGTVVIDGVSQGSYNPNSGFSLTDLTPNQYHTITFTYHVDSLPQNGKVDNKADITFTYKLTPSDDPVTTVTSSNTVTTYIRIGYLSSTKTVDKAYATIGDTLKYTITINNSGNANCSDIFFRDIIQSNGSFVSGTVKINNVAYSEYNPNTGFYLEDIPGLGNSVVTFEVKVQTLPSDYVIYNYATVSYKYYIDPSKPSILVQGTSNTVTTVINVGSLSVTKAVSKSYATIGDVLTYTVTIYNSGNTIAKNINFRDTIPTGLTMVQGSVTINGTPYPSYDPYDSFTLGNLISGDTVVVAFNASVTSLPTPSLISNTANVIFFYRIDPNGSDIAVQVNSNTVTTQINVGSLSLTKAVDKAYCTMGYVLTYTVVVSNSGNVTAKNVIFGDNLQSDITFNEGSVKVDGTTHPDYDVNVGFTLGDIEPLNSVTVIFTATVILSPTHASVLNYAVGTFSYKIDPNGQDYNKSSQSNTVSTIIIKPSITASKVVDKLYATLQDVLNYSILLSNTGNTSISQIQFADFLSNGAVFIPGTVVIDGVSYPTFDPIAGFDLPSSLISGNTSLIKFQTTVTSIPSPAQVTNYAVSNGLYYVDPQGATYPITTTSNTVTTNINIGSLSNTKTVSKLYAKVNDTVTYTSTITNTGNVNASSLFFKDALQTELTYVSGTVNINGIVYPALNPTVGFELSDLAPGQTVTVTFDAKINALPITSAVINSSLIQFSYYINPTGSPITKTTTSNTVTTNVVLGKINATKVVDKSIATVGDELTYTITLTNVGNVIDNNVMFYDTPSNGAVFKQGSVVVNNVSKPSYDPTVGFSLGDIGIGNVVTIAFVATVTSVPATNQVTNQASISFQYVVAPKQQPYSDTSYSNTVTTNIAYGNLSVSKSVDKQYATIGEQLTYTVIVTNTGNIDATNVIFLDPTPHNSVFVLGSVTVNGISYTEYNPSAGFDLNTMTPGQIITVKYKVQVINLC